MSSLFHPVSALLEKVSRQRAEESGEGRRAGASERDDEPRRGEEIGGGVPASLRACESGTAAALVCATAADADLFRFRSSGRPPPLVSSSSSSSSSVAQLSRRGAEDVDVRYMCLRDLAAELHRMRSAQTSAAGTPAAAAGAAATGSSASALGAVAPVVSVVAPLDATVQARLCKALMAELMASQAEIHEAAITWSADGHRPARL
jgi:hypothetical protein